MTACLPATGAWKLVAGHLDIDSWTLEIGGRLGRDIDY